jgi:hypothetical integral membrane protein (TIGR02206 family)
MFSDYLEFKLFGPLHIAVIITTFLGVILIQILRSNNRLKYFLAFGLIAQILAFNLFHIIRGSYDIYRYLPLHLCTLSAFLAPFALLTKNRVISNLLLFWGLIPAFLAILFPDMGSSEGILTFRFWEFFLSHILIVLSAFYISIHSDLLFKLRDFSTWKEIVISFFVLALYAFGLVYPINILLGNEANYLYLLKKSSNGMSFLPEGSLYIPSLIILTLIVFIIEAIIYRLYNFFKRFDKS